MASPGEIAYHHFIMRIVEKGSSRYISVHDVQSMGSYFWGLMSEDFKQISKNEKRRKAFWNFAQTLKLCITTQNSEALFDLWENFDTNGKNMWENFYENCLNYYVDTIL